LDDHVSWYSPTTEEDNDALDMVFSKNRAKDRRSWLVGRGKDEQIQVRMNQDIGASKKAITVFFY